MRRGRYTVYTVSPGGLWTTWAAEVTRPEADRLGQRYLGYAQRRPDRIARVLVMHHPNGTLTDAATGEPTSI